MPQLDDLSGKVFCRWSVIKRAPRRRRISAEWTCKCSCGKESVVAGQALRNGKSKSCGCLNREITTKLWTTHGLSGTKVYRAWCLMLQRCYNASPKIYPYYQGRGIIVCESWHTFENFFADMGHPPSIAHSLDRINNNGNYEPDNCRWATKREQSMNTRRNLHNRGMK